MGKPPMFEDVKNEERSRASGNAARGCSKSNKKHQKNILVVINSKTGGHPGVTPFEGTSPSCREKGLPKKRQKKILFGIPPPNTL